MKRIRRLNGCFLSCLNCVESPHSDNNGVPTVPCLEYVFRKPAFVFRSSISLIGCSIHNAKVFYPVIPFISVDVVDIQALWNRSVMPNPYQSVKEDTPSANRDFSVRACPRASIACDLLSSSSDTWTPNPPKQFSIGAVVKHTLQFFLGWYSAGRDHNYTPVLKCN